METMTISEELMAKICGSIKPQEFCWSQGAEADEKQTMKAIRSQESVCEFRDEIWENSIDYTWDLEKGSMTEAVKEWQSEIEEELGLDEGELDVDEFVSEHEDEMRDHTSVDMLEHELLGTVNVMVVMHSNFDCINSHHFETYGGGGYEYPNSYFADVVDALNFNPATMKRMLNAKGISTFGRWPNYKWRDGKEFISYDDFWVEEENRCSPACLLVFMGQLDARQMYKDGVFLDDVAHVIIPKGNNVGFFSNWEGGGSMIDAPLLRDMRLDLNKTYHKSYSFDICLDGESGYGAKDVYGAYDSFFGGELTLIKSKQ